MKSKRKKLARRLDILANKGDDARHITNLLKSYEKKASKIKEIIVEDGNV